LKKLSLAIFANNFITTLLGIFPHEIGEKKSLFHIGTGTDIRPQKRSRKIADQVCYSDWVEPLVL